MSLACALFCFLSSISLEILLFDVVWVSNKNTGHVPVNFGYLTWTIFCLFYNFIYLFHSLNFMYGCKHSTGNIFSIRRSCDACKTIYCFRCRLLWIARIEGCECKECAREVPSLNVENVRRNKDTKKKMWCIRKVLHGMYQSFVSWPTLWHTFKSRGLRERRSENK